MPKMYKGQTIRINGKIHHILLKYPVNDKHKKQHVRVLQRLCRVVTTALQYSDNSFAVFLKKHKPIIISMGKMV